MGTSDLRGDHEHQSGKLEVTRPAGLAKNQFETFIRITADGSVTAFNGHVDLGTGIRTALGQIVAEERGLTAPEGRAMASEFLERQGRSRLVALGPQQARQEALALAHMRSSMGLR